MKNILALLLVLCGILYASYSRIESMGKTDFYFEDDMNMFVNPANMLLHKSYIFGELGTTQGNDTGAFIDPYSIREAAYNPWFGGVFSKDLKSESRFSIGMAFNRDDKWLSLLNGIVHKANTDTLFSDTNGTCLINLPTPINKFDLLVGYRHSSRFSLGALLYAAANKDNQTLNATQYSKREVFIFKGILGFNKHFMNNFFLEGSFGTSITDFTYRSFDQLINVKPRKGLNLFGRARMFIPLSARFSLVPIANYEQVFQGKKVDDLRPGNVKHVEDINDYLDAAGGFGINFFDTDKKTEFIVGIDGHFLKAQDEQQSTVASQTYSGGKREDLYAVVNFGIERQLHWDWLLARAGGRKVLGLSSKRTNYNPALNESLSEEKMWENPLNDNTRADLIGVGLGVHFLRKMQLDFTLSETAPYNILYLISGVSGNIFTRFSCSYYF